MIFDHGSLPFVDGEDRTSDQQNQSVSDTDEERHSSLLSLLAHGFPYTLVMLIAVISYLRSPKTVITVILTMWDGFLELLQTVRRIVAARR